MSLLEDDLRGDITDAWVDDFDLRCVSGMDDFLVPRSFAYGWTFRGVARRRDTPIGWTTDLASVPRAVWSIVPPHKRIKKAAVPHDDLYGNRPKFDGVRITRAEADAVLWALCVKEGLSERECEAVYTTVRLGGSPTWHAHDGYFASLDAMPPPSSSIVHAGTVPAFAGALA